MKSTLSFRVSADCNEQHNLRQIPVPYADKSKEKDNIYLQTQTRQEAFDYLFGEAVKKYNETQKRKDRRIENYLEKIQKAEREQEKKIAKMRSEGASYKAIARNKKAKRSASEIIVSLGNMQENPEFCGGGEKEHIVKEILQRYINDFQKRNPNFYLYCASVHSDEQGVIHAHLDYVPFSDSFNSGLQRRLSMEKALNDMGFYTNEEKISDGKRVLAITKWENSEREVLKEIAKEYDIDIVCGKASRQHVNRENYIIRKKQEEIEKKNKSIENCLAQIDSFLKNHERGNEFYLTVELDNKQKELEELQKEYAEMQEEYCRLKRENCCEFEEEL